MFQRFYPSANMMCVWFTSTTTTHQASPSLFLCCQNTKPCLTCHRNTTQPPPFKPANTLQLTYLSQLAAAVELASLTQCFFLEALCAKVQTLNISIGIPQTLWVRTFKPRVHHHSWCWMLAVAETILR